LVKYYDQVAGVKELTQPNETRQYKIAASGAVIDWVAHSGGSGADYYLLNSGLPAADNLSVFTFYSSRIEAALGVESASVWSIGQGGTSAVLAHISASGVIGMDDELMVLDVRTSGTGTQRLGSTALEYSRAADTDVLEAVIFTGNTAKFYQDDTEITLDENVGRTPTGDFAPSSQTITDTLRVGSQNNGGSPSSQADLTVGAIVFYTTDEEANQTAIHDDLKSAVTNEFRVMTQNVRDMSDTASTDVKYVDMEKQVVRYDPDILAFQEIASGSVSLITGEFATDNGYPYTYYGQLEAYTIVLLSKYPITYSELVDSPDGDAFDRPARYIEIEKNGRPFGIYGVHMATFCESGPCSAAAPDHEAQRAMELEIIGMHKEERLALNSRLEFVMMGDFNGDSATQTHDTSIASYVGAPSTVTFPITVKTGAGATDGYPETQLTAYGMTASNSTTIAGNTSTLWEHPTGPNALLTYESHVDEVAISSGLTLLGSETADSEGTQAGGILKYTPLLTVGSGPTYLDHQAVIADISF